MLGHYYFFIFQIGKHKKNQFSHRIGEHFVKIGLQILMQNHFSYVVVIVCIVSTFKSKWTVYITPIPDVIWASLSAFWNFLLMEYNVLGMTDAVLWESSSCSLHSIFSGVRNIFSFCLSIDLGHLEFLLNHEKKII